ncbi:hypothetical protein C8N46_105223 [Kordia periserrulae]|uniref:TIR domain-containing protein n=1 Tax=Kordia periserrulae TaxID=701523 RepID=A0A2T6BYM0_9FLAO|nr:hypothetical protein [Kordia periserrulae]PTX61067.1 hypothetical protein C8N46_105223 [Kordia periserrulae]
MKNVFVTYNVGSESGENTALRLQTLSNLYGFNVDLPYRGVFGNLLHSETKKRIERSSFILSFSTDLHQSENLKNELIYADSIGKPIVIAFNQHQNKPNIPVKGNNVKFFPINFYDIDNSIKKIASFLDKQLNKGHLTNKKESKNKDDGAAKVLLALGLGLLAAWAISSATKED